MPQCKIEIILDTDDRDDDGRPRAVVRFPQTNIGATDLGYLVGVSIGTLQTIDASLPGSFPAPMNKYRSSYLAGRCLGWEDGVTTSCHQMIDCRVHDADEEFADGSDEG